MEQVLINTRFCLEIQRIVNIKGLIIPRLTKFVKRYKLGVRFLPEGDHVISAIHGNYETANSFIQFLLPELSFAFKDVEVRRYDGSLWKYKRYKTNGKTEDCLIFVFNKNFVELLVKFQNDFIKHFETLMLQSNNQQIFIERQIMPVLTLFKWYKDFYHNNPNEFLPLKYCLFNNNITVYFESILELIKQAETKILKHYPEIELNNHTTEQKNQSMKNNANITIIGNNNKIIDKKQMKQGNKEIEKKSIWTKIITFLLPFLQKL